MLHYPPSNSTGIPIAFVLEMGGVSYPLSISPFEGSGDGISIVQIGPDEWSVTGLIYSTDYILSWVCDDTSEACHLGIWFSFFSTVSDPDATPTPSPTPTPTPSPTASPSPTVSPTPSDSPTPSPTCVPGAPTFVAITFGEVQDPLPTYHPGGTVTLTAMPVELADFPTTPSLATWTSNWGLFLRGEEITRTITFPDPGPDIAEIRVGMTGPGNPCPAWSSDTAYYRAVRVTLTPTGTPVVTPQPTPTTPVPTPVPTITQTPQPTPSPLPTPTVGGGDGWVVREVGLRAD